MDRDKLHCAEERIRLLLDASRVPQENGHAINTLEWLLRLKPDADLALRMAAIAHDIERGDRIAGIDRNDYENFDEFKSAHAARSAELVTEILQECGLAPAFVADVADLVRTHEVGGTDRADLLNWADSISYFDNNLLQYARRHSEEETRHRVEWGLKRLPPNLRDTVTCLNYEEGSLSELVKTIAGELKTAAE